MAQNSMTSDSFNYYYFQGNYSRALKYLGVIDDDCDDFVLVKTVGYSYLQTMEYDSALKYFMQADQLNNISDKEKYELLVNIAFTYRGLNKLKKMYSSLNQARALNKQYGPFDDTRYKFCLSQYYDRTQMPDSAEKYLIQAIESFSHGNNERIGEGLKLYAYTTTFYKNMGEFHKATQYGKAGLQLAGKRDGNIDFLFLFNYTLGIAYYSMQDWDQSIFYFTKALGHITANNSFYKPYIESALAYCYSKTGSKSFDSLFIQSSTDYENIDTVAWAYHMICYGKHLKNQQFNQNRSMEYYKRAFRLLKIKYGVYDDKLKDIYYVLGYETQNHKHYDSSLCYLQRALYCVSPRVDTINYSSNPSSKKYWDKWVLDVIDTKLMVLDKIYQSPLDPDSTLAISRLILDNTNSYISILENLLRNKTYIKDKLFVLREKIRKRMLTAINVCWGLYNQTGNEYYAEKGLEFSETGKYLLLKSMIDEKAEKQQLPDDISRADLMLQNEINRLHMLKSRTLVKQGHENKYYNDSLDQKLFSLILQKDSLRTVVLNKYPIVHKYERHHISLKDIRDRLVLGQVLVEYFVQDSVLHAFFINKDGLIWEKVDNAGSLILAVDNVVRFCNLNVYGKTTKAEYINDALLLYEALLSPIEKLEQQTSELLIIPDGKLNYLPFDILLKENVDEHTEYREMPYLLREKAISYYHSVRFLQNQQLCHDRHVERLLAVIPEYTYDINDRSRKNLSKTIEEASYLPELSVSDLLAGDEATKANYYEFAPGSDIIHFASHAVADTINAFDSYILLAYDTLKKEEEKLYASEISCMNLDSKMVVLNSCSGGSGRLQAGEGVISLAWAFNYAGCESVVMSPNPLDDLSAQKIIALFYKYLISGKRKSEALRQAKMDFLEEIGPGKTHPAYWGGLIVSGNQEPLIMKNNSKGKTILMLSISVIIVALLFFIYRKLLISSFCSKRF